MMNERGNIRRVCSFYVNEVHLVTMLLPHVNKKSEEGFCITSFAEESLQKAVELLISRLNIKEESQNKILKVFSTNKKAYKYQEVEKHFCQTIVKGKNNIIIVSGQKEYIEIVNKNILKWNKTRREVIDVINCYEVTQFNDNIKEILDSHDKILNTSGEREITEVFEGYQKVI